MNRLHPDLLISPKLFTRLCEERRTRRNEQALERIELLLEFHLLCVVGKLRIDAAVRQAA